MISFQIRINCLIYYMESLINVDENTSTISYPVYSDSVIKLIWNEDVWYFMPNLCFFDANNFKSSFVQYLIQAIKFTKQWVYVQAKNFEIRLFQRAKIIQIYFALVFINIKRFKASSNIFLKVNLWKIWVIEGKKFQGYYQPLGFCRCACKNIFFIKFL